MKNKNGKPLIRKDYTFTAMLKMIFSKFSRMKNGRDLRIPGFAETIEFKSVATSREVRSSAADASQFSREQILSAMRVNNLRGHGGADFPMADKLEAVLSSGNASPVLIINGVECDPGLYHDKWIIENKQRELEAVSNMLKSAFSLSGVYLAQKDGTASADINGMTSVMVPDTYPAGEEKKLVSWLLGIECSEDTYPANKGIWVQNVQSLLILHSVLSGTLPRRYVTMAELDRKHAVVVECDADASVGDLSREVFGQHGQIYLGGGLMQSFSATGDETLDCSINLISTGKTAGFTDKDCRHCGQCTQYCPALLPVEALVNEITKGGDVTNSERDKCRRCGACSFLCPAGKDVCSLIALA